jgi:hypothetical protein
LIPWSGLDSTPSVQRRKFTGVVHRSQHSCECVSPKITCSALSDSSSRNVSGIERSRRTKKISGEAGIRTLGRFPDSGFQDQCNSPLCHLSGYPTRAAPDLLTDSSVVYSKLEFFSIRLSYHSSSSRALPSQNLSEATSHNDWLTPNERSPWVGVLPKSTGWSQSGTMRLDRAPISPPSVGRCEQQNPC